MRSQIEAADGNTVMVKRISGSPPYASAFVCITGIVQPDLVLQEGVVESFSDSFGKRMGASVW